MTTCTFLRCAAPAVQRTKRPYDRSWFAGCPVHIDAMIDAMGIGLPEADDPVVEDIVPDTAIGRAAVALAKLGWEVFPLRRKAPAIRSPHPQGSRERAECKGECGQLGHGLYDATCDLRQVTAWWSGTYRGANIGARVPKGVMVVDVDVRHGGDATLDRLVAEHGPLPTTREVASGRGDGGAHHYFRTPPGRLTEERLGAGLDLKTHAGYVVLPPSVHSDSGQPYRWLNGAPIADPPPWLAELVTATEADTATRETASSAPSGFTTPNSPGSPALRLRGILRRLSASPQGERNDVLYWAAKKVGGMLRDGELPDPTKAADALTTVALAIGLDPREIHKTIKSGFDKSGATL